MWEEKCKGCKYDLTEEQIKKLKEEAYKIATEACNIGQKEDYKWCVEARLDAMEVYARLVIAENLQHK
jgi:hypothetical protein